MNRRISHADAMRSTPGRGPGHPQSPLIRLDVRRPCGLRRRRAARPCRTCAPRAASAASTRGRGRRCRRSRCARCRQPFAEDVRADGAAPARACPRGRRRAGRALQDLLDVAGQRRVGLLPRAPELLDQRVVGPGIDVVGGKHARVAACPLDLGLQPLEVFASTRSVGQRRTPPA